MRLVLDSGAVTRLARADGFTGKAIEDFRRLGLWPASVPSAVLVESLSGRPHLDARTNRLLKGCEIVTDLPEALARRCASLRQSAGRGSAVDAIVVGLAEPDGLVLTADLEDLRALAEGTGVIVRGI